MGIKIEGYFSDKFAGRDEKQINSLSDEQRSILFNGSREEVIKTIEDIRARERLQRVTLLGEAALEYIQDVRTIKELYRNGEFNKPSLFDKLNTFLKKK